MVPGDPVSQALHPSSLARPAFVRTLSPRRVLLVGEPPEWRPGPAARGAAEPLALELVVVAFAEAGPLLASRDFEVAVVNLTRDAAARLDAVREWRLANPAAIWLTMVGPEPMLSDEVMLRAGIAEEIAEAEMAQGLGRAVRRALARRDAARAQAPIAPPDWESSPVESTRLSSLGSVAAGVAHEINNPLSYIRSNLEFVLEEFDSLQDRFARLVARFPNVAGGATGFPDLAERMAELRRAMDEANEGVTRVTHVVGGLKQFSSRPRTEVSKLSLMEIAEASLRIASRTIADCARFETRFDPAPAVRGSIAYLGQVVLNLLVNAAQAVPEAGPGEHRVVLATYRNPEGHAVLEVSDTGPGMTRELASKIFEPFFTTKPEGTGLGLSVSRRVVEAFGGDLTVETQPGQGSTFRMRLPPA